MAMSQSHSPTSDAKILDLLQQQTNIVKLSLQGGKDDSVTMEAIRLTQMTTSILSQRRGPSIPEQLPSSDKSKLERNSRRYNRHSPSRKIWTKSSKKTKKTTLTNFDSDDEEKEHPKAPSSTEGEKSLSHTDDMTTSDLTISSSSDLTSEEADRQEPLEKATTYPPSDTTDDEEEREEQMTAKKTYDALYSSTTQFIKKYTKGSKKPTYLVSLAKRRSDRYDDQIGGAHFKDLHAIAKALYKNNTYSKRIALPTFCITKLSSQKKVDSLHLLYFCKAMHGAGDSDPDKWSPLKRIMIIAVVVIIISVLAGFLLSLSLGFFYIGSHAALSTPFISILQQGWELLLPYKFVIPIVSGIANQLLVSYFFGKSSIQKKLAEFDKSTKHPRTYPHYNASLELLRTSINNLKSSPLKERLSGLYNKLLSQVGEAASEESADPNKMKYLMPILFTATAFANNLTQKNKSEKLINLSFYALKGSGFTEPPDQSFWKKMLGRALPVVIIIVLATILGFFWLSSFHAFLILNTAITVLSECVSLVPKDMLDTEHQERANKIFKNSITQSITEIEEALTDSIQLQPSCSHGQVREDLSPTSKRRSVPVASPVAFPVTSFVTTPPPKRHKKQPKRLPEKYPEKRYNYQSCSRSPS